MKKAYEDRTWSLLIASAAMSDPLFEKSVILILEDNNEGSFGVVINKKESSSLLEFSNKFKDFNKLKDLQLYDGGPVGKDKLTIAVWSNLDDSMGNFSFGVTPIKAEKFLSQKASSNGAVFSGFCTWQKGQLEAEIAEGMWFLAEVDLSLLDDNQTDGIWEMLLLNANPIFEKLPPPKSAKESKN